MSRHRHPRPQPPARRDWRPLRRVLNVLFFAAVLALLVVFGRRLEWHEVWTSLRGYRLETLLMASAAAFGSYLLYCCFDLLGRVYTRHRLPLRQVIPVTFVCYAFNLNLSAWVGSIALRYRLYSRFGLQPSVITKVLTLSLMTNWLGYIGVAGVVFALGRVRPPGDWELGVHGLRVLGWALLAFVLVYLLLCAFSRRRFWSIRGHKIYLPSLRLGLLQLVLGAGNWLLMALVLNILLPPQLTYSATLGALLVSAIAGVITHIPAGLGVLEAVFIALLQRQTSVAALLAGLFGYRVVYYLLPLALAGVTYLVLELRARQHPGRAAAGKT